MPDTRDVFISYARSSEDDAHRIAQSLRGAGFSVWRDDELPAHRSYSDVIEERLKSAKAVVVLWSAESAKSHWVRAEANTALEGGTLVQAMLDGTFPPMPFNQIQCADLKGWKGETTSPGWQ
jgi:adenylate cyclase